MSALPELSGFAPGVTSLQQTQLHQQLHVKSTVLHSFRIQINTEQLLQVPVPGMAQPNPTQIQSFWKYFTASLILK